MPLEIFMHLVQTMAYVGQEPWHGLGNLLSPHQPLETWAREAGMDWQIETADVRHVAGGDGLGSICAFTLCHDHLGENNAL
jgi:hypothetical protein